MNEANIISDINTKTFKNYTAKWSYPIDDDDSNVCQDQNVEVSFYKNDVFQYKLTKNPYRTENDKFMLLEWFKVDNKTVFLFNLSHGCISVIDADTGKELTKTENNDMFLSEYELFDDREYLYATGWIWTPLSGRCVYHIPSLLSTIDTNEKYNSIMIDCIDARSEGNLIPKISIFGCKSCKEFLEQRDDIFEKLRTQYDTEAFNEVMDKGKNTDKNKDFLLKRIFNEQVFNDLFNKDPITSFRIKCFDNISNERQGKYDRVLINEIKISDNILYQGEIVKNNITALIPYMLIPTFLTNLPFPEYNLRYEITIKTKTNQINSKTNNQTIVLVFINQELTWNGKPELYPNDSKRYDVDLSKRVIVGVKIV